MGIHLRVRQTLTGSLQADAGFQTRFRRLESAPRAVLQSLPVCTRLPSVRTTCEHGIRTRTHLICQHLIPQCHHLMSRLLPNISEARAITAQTTARPTTNSHRPSQRGMNPTTPHTGEIVRRDNPSFRFSTRLSRMRVVCGNERIGH